MNSTTLRQTILDMGASLVGFADMQGLAPDPFADLPRAVSIAVRLSPDIVDDILSGPTLEYQTEYERVNTLLNEIAGKSVQLIRARDYRAEYFPVTIRDSAMGGDYPQTLRVAFQHKTAATRAGLGWIGKCALFISCDLGPRIRLVTAFTDMPLETGTPIVEGTCGDCTVCVTACPAQAISGREWRLGMRREEFFDAHACRNTCRRLMRERTGMDAALCGLCVAICPKGKRQGGG